MAHTLAPPGTPVVTRSVSAARLHGEACWHCGAVLAGLTVVGMVAVPRVSGDESRVWPVVACAPHRTLEIG